MNRTKPTLLHPTPRRPIFFPHFKNPDLLTLPINLTPPNELYREKISVFERNIEAAFTPLPHAKESLSQFSLHALRFFSLIQARKLTHPELEAEHTDSSTNFEGTFACACFIHHYNTNFHSHLLDFTLKGKHDLASNDEKIKHLAALFILFVQSLDKQPLEKFTYLAHNGIDGNLLKKAAIYEDHRRTIAGIPDSQARSPEPDLATPAILGIGTLALLFFTLKNHVF